MKVKIITKSPIHVGSGDRYGAMDTYIDGDRIVRVNMDTIFGDDSLLIKKYVNAIDSRNFTELQRILRNGEIRYTAKIRDGVRITRMEEEIHEYLKDANGDVPYIPGSTIKGFIRTALLIKYLKDHGGKFSLSISGNIANYNIIHAMRNGIREIKVWPLGSDRWQDRSSKNLGKRFEEMIAYTGNIKLGKMFKYDAKYDIFKFMNVGDFYPKKYELWVDKATRYSGFRPGAHLFIETVEGEFTGEISLSPTITLAMKNKNSYPILADKMKILGISSADLSDLKKVEEKMVSHIISAMEEFLKDIKEYSYKTGRKFNKPDGANLRLGFGTGLLYKTLWIYLASQDKRLATNVLRKLPGRRGSVDRYPKSHYKLSDGRELGWATAEVVR